ncbi:unnamed protein product, partial [Larinioides sclopetarius]
ITWGFASQKSVNYITHSIHFKYFVDLPRFKPGLAASRNSQKQMILAIHIIASRYGHVITAPIFHLYAREIYCRSPYKKIKDDHFFGKSGCKN